MGIICLMAVYRKKSSKKRTSGSWLLFWFIFFIGITLLFMTNLENIKKTLAETRILGRLVPVSDSAPTPDLETSAVEAAELPALSNNPKPAAPAKPDTTAKTDASAKPETTAKPDVKTVDRSVYLMKVDNAGSVYWTKVKRTLPASDKPLQDALESVIKGPSAEEEKQGLVSLIPKNAKIQSASVKGNTAYISFSEEFLFNTYGTEGYASQRRQIVLTATEFSNVKDVQILIDGKRIDYLGEGVWIGSPVSRTML
jgi:spore germination protein GerM